MHSFSFLAVAVSVCCLLSVHVGVVADLPPQVALPPPKFNLDFSKGNGTNYYTQPSQVDDFGVKRCTVGVFTGGPEHSGTFVDLNNVADTHQTPFPTFGSATGLSWTFSTLYTDNQAWERLFDCGIAQDVEQIDFTRNDMTNNLLIEDSAGASGFSSVEDTSGTSYPLNKWQTYGVSVTPDNVISIYVDGVKKASQGGQVVVNTVERPLCFLGFSLAELLPNRPDQRAEGFIDRFAFWDTVLTDAQFASLANYDDSCASDYQNPDPVPSGARGDPQFTGFMGQSFQVHGTSDAYYNILSTPHLSFVAHFSYLESGKCRAGTQCFSHPGNYFSEVGLSIRDESSAVNHIRVIAGPVDRGLVVMQNDKILSIPSRITIGMYQIQLESAFELIVESPEFNIRISNSDMFLNQDISIGEGLLAEIAQLKSAQKSGNSTAADQIVAKLPHGILGQTYATKQYQNRWKHIEGLLFDYQVDALNATQFKYSRF